MRILACACAAALGAVGLVVSPGCLQLPANLGYEVALRPSDELVVQDGYHFDPEDSTTVFETAGMRLKVRYLTDATLNQEYSRYTFREPNLNPFTYGTDRDLDRGYTPPRFTVFAVTLVNLGLPKVRVDPAKVRLHTDRGGVCEAWGVQEGDAQDSFEQYYMERRGEGGNEEYYFRERLGIVRQALYRRDTWVWRGESYTGKVVFAPLHEGVRQVRLSVAEVVLRVDSFERPKETVNAAFVFEVEQGVVGRPDGSGNRVR